MKEEMEEKMSLAFTLSERGSNLGLLPFLVHSILDTLISISIQGDDTAF